MKATSPHDYVDLLYRHRWIIAIPIVVAMIIAAGLAMILPKAYRSSTLILVEPQKVPEEYIKSTVSSIEDRLSTIRQQLFSRSLLQRIIDEFKLYPGKAGKMTTEEIIDLMRQQITVKTVKGKNVDAFTISFVGSNPTTTMNVTNKLASLFIEENLKIREQLVEGTSDFLDLELSRLKNTLEAQERRISDYKQRHMGSLPSQIEANLRMLDRLQLQLQAAMTALSEAMNRRSAMEAQLANDAGELPPLPATALADPRLVQLQMLKRRLTTLEAEYTENYPDIQITKEEIAQLEIELKLNVTAGSQTNPTTALSAPPASPAGSGEVTLGQEIARLQQQQHALAEQISLYEKRVEETPKREQEMAGLMRNYEATKENYNILLSKAGNAKISENMEKRQKGEQFRILDPANYPEQPFKPDLSELLLIGLLLGAGIGGGLALMLENFDTSIKQSDELEAEFGIQVLSVIPKAALLCKPTELNGATAGVAPVLPKEARS